MPIAYVLEPNLSAREFRDVLKTSRLGERRPIDNPGYNGDIIVTACEDGKIGLFFISAPAELGYYPTIGMKDYPCFGRARRQ